MFSKIIKLALLTCVVLWGFVETPVVHAQAESLSKVVLKNPVVAIEATPTPMTTPMTTVTPDPALRIPVMTFGVTPTPISSGASLLPWEVALTTQAVVEPTCGPACTNWGWLTTRTGFFYKEGPYSKLEDYVDGKTLGFQVDSSGNFVNGIPFDKMEFCSWDLPAENSGSCINGGTLVFFDVENISFEDLPYYSDGWTYVSDFLENEAYIFGGRFVAIVFDGHLAANQGKSLPGAFECYSGPMILKAPEMVSGSGIRHLAQNAHFAIPVPGDFVSELTVIGVLLDEDGEIVVNPDTKVAVLIVPHEDASGCNSYAE